MRILIVEDEGSLANGLKFNFEQEGFEVITVEDGPSALEIFEPDGIGGEPCDLVILDLMLPGMSGYETCRAIRALDDHIPILVLSARTLAEDKTRAFDCGSDQYMTKPFALPELLSRVRNLLDRRSRAVNAHGNETRKLDVYEFDNIHVDFTKFEITISGATRSLTTMEMQLLRYFVENEGVVLSRSRILEDVWGKTAGITTRSIDNFVMRLRKLIEANPAEPQRILSVRGTGYRFVTDQDNLSLSQ